MDIDFELVYLLPQLHRHFLTTTCVSIVFLPRLISLPIRRFMQVAFKGMPTCAGHFSLKLNFERLLGTH